MIKKVGRLGILAALVAVLVFALGGIALFYTEVGMASEIGEGVQETYLPECEYAAIPPSVVEDATALARELVGDGHDRFQDLVNQLLASYMEARDRDIVVVFNSGGWGWNLLAETPGWASIIEGIKAELDGLDYKSLVLNYHRTGGGLRACVREFFEVFNHAPSKAKELAGRIEFLTEHIPNLRVIVAGESTGTVISDGAMNILRDNTRVYSIQTGTPFWHKPVALDRTLLMNSNGKTLDTFSYGKVTAMVWASVKGWFGFLSPEENPGTVLSWLRAPGHDYSWQYTGVCSAVAEFLEENFGSSS
ncbi:hypothetical protein ACFLX3_04640 [Chloroflexota bacterium]